MKMHILGIGGVGMAGIAELALDKGYSISGTDLKKSETVTSFDAKGVTIYSQHSSDNITDEISVVVKSGAVKDNNEEITEAVKKRIPVWNRMYVLNRLVSDNENIISVVGSCGKTSMVAILEHIFRDENPTVYMGARSEITHKFGKAGKGKYALCECCEYKGAFFDFQGDYAVLTSVIKNHEDYYGSDIITTIKAFNNFFELSGIKRVYMPFELKSYFSPLSTKYEIVTVGCSEGDYQYCNVEYSGSKSSFKLKGNSRDYGLFRTALFGSQYIIELVLGIAVAVELGLDIDVIRQNIVSVCLPNRRMQVKYNSKRYLLINDNARIPKQIDASLKAVKENFPNAVLICILGIWGRLNARPIEELSQVLKQTDAVFFPPLGDCAVSCGGAEPDNAVELIKSKMFGNETAIYDDFKLEQILAIIYEYNKKYPNRKKVVITLGYDKYNKDFCNILDAIEAEVSK